MRYIMFVAVDQDPDPSSEPLPSVDDWFDEINGDGTWVIGERLRPVSEARLVRVRDGRTLVTDAAFTESKEWIAGFDVLECGSIEEAVAIAAKHPMARGGRIEVREFWPLSQPDD
ncbi:MAG: hypothetical protein BGO26_18090 [Actinobacteria bacterium 69-20]|nr:hypothetical protein [Actinomycetota bacterium]OJV24503.1 MAG: hypothetical protein BGO26_18090 [Actinobacteria bacterium 69-20]